MRGMDSILASAIKDAGGTTVVADRLGESPQTINNWVGRGVPVARCAALEAALGGAVKRWHMRPLDWWEIWPELIHAEGAPKSPALAG